MGVTNFGRAGNPLPYGNPIFDLPPPVYYYFAYVLLYYCYGSIACWCYYLCILADNIKATNFEHKKIHLKYAHCHL